MSTTTLVLGGGFGGMAAANKLRRLLPAEHRVVLVDQSPTYLVGAGKTWLMLGEKRLDEVTRDRASLLEAGVDFLREVVGAIDIPSRTVTTSGRTIPWDHLVIALGADVSMDGVPGLREEAHTFYTLEGAERVRDVIAEFKGSEMVIVIQKPPFKCPPAPYEAAMLLHAHLRERGHATKISIHTPEGIPMATAGPEIGAYIKGELAARGIELHAKRQLKNVDAASKQLHFADGSSASYDLLLCVPAHQAPAVVKEAGLLNQGGWISVDSQTMEVTGVHGEGRVFAIGDVTTVALPGRFLHDVALVLPKAGVMAEAQAEVAASRIADRVLGREPTAEFDGRGFCYLELGGGMAVRAEGSFFELPHPVMEKREPDAAQLAHKHEWVAAHLQPVAQ